MIREDVARDGVHPGFDALRGAEDRQSGMDTEKHLLQQVIGRIT
jgi:hypothetical protein